MANVDKVRVIITLKNVCLLTVSKNSSGRFFEELTAQLGKEIWQLEVACFPRTRWTRGPPRCSCPGTAALLELPSPRVRSHKTWKHSHKMMITAFGNSYLTLAKCNQIDKHSCSLPLLATLKKFCCLTLRIREACHTLFFALLGTWCASCTYVLIVLRSLSLDRALVRNTSWPSMI